MDHALLKALPVALLLALSGGLSGCLFDDPLLELDPALDPAVLDDGSFDTLLASESYPVTRKHILESFGAFACANCPGAEARLSAWLHAAPGSPRHSPSLVIVNYHVAFPGTLQDPWITPATQARYDQFGFSGLPQVKLNGSNAPYGIREKNVLHDGGEYDSLFARLRLVDSLTRLDLRVDTGDYDSATQRLTVRFSALNRDTTARGPLAFHVLAVKNRSFPFYYPNHAWEVVVAQAGDRDSAGTLMTLPGMAGLRSRSWTVSLAVPPESTRSPTPSPLENPADYAIVVFARDAGGVVLNVATRNYAPVP